MLQLLRPRSNRADGEAALSSLFEEHDLTASLSSDSDWMRRLSRFKDALHDRIRTSLAAAVGIASHAPLLARIASDNEASGATLARASELIACASEQVTTTLDVELVPGATQVAHCAGKSPRHCATASRTEPGCCNRSTPSKPAKPNWRR